MKTIHEQATVSYTQEQMYDLVSDVERYPEFLPFCTHGELLSSSADVDVSRLDFGIQGLSYSLTTKNSKSFPAAFDMELLEGPFRIFHALWQFSSQDTGARISVACEFELSSRTAMLLMGAKFEQAVRDQVGAFCSRADKLYG